MGSREHGARSSAPRSGAGQLRPDVKIDHDRRRRSLLALELSELPALLRRGALDRGRRAGDAAVVDRSRGAPRRRARARCARRAAEKWRDGPCDSTRERVERRALRVGREPREHGAARDGSLERDPRARLGARLRVVLLCGRPISGRSTSTTSTSAARAARASATARLRRSARRSRTATPGGSR